jgi:outer membrane lipoprotein SlyB
MISKSKVPSFKEMTTMNDLQKSEPQDKHLNVQEENSDSAALASIPSSSHPMATGLGAIGGSVAGAAIGDSVGGRVGATLGAVAGAIAGSIAGNALAEIAEEVAQEVNETIGLDLGADKKEIELPRHYSWDELRALSKPRFEEPFSKRDLP